jgi:hypothetical protein
LRNELSSILPFDAPSIVGLSGRIHGLFGFRTKRPH